MHRGGGTVYVKMIGNVKSESSERKSIEIENMMPGFSFWGLLITKSKIFIRLSHAYSGFDALSPISVHIICSYDPVSGLSKQVCSEI